MFLSVRRMVLLAAVVLPYCNASCIELLEEFDSYQDQEPWTGSGQWIVEEPGALALGEEYRRGASGKGILIGASGAAELRAPIYKPGLKLSDETVTARCYINVRDESGRFDFYTRGEVDGGEAETLSHIVLNQGQIFTGVHGGGLQACGTYSPETWVGLLVEIDLKNQHYDLYVDNVLVQSKVPFACPPGVKAMNVDIVVIAKNLEGPGAAWVDDIAVISGTKDGLTSLSPDGQPGPSKLTLDLAGSNWSRPKSAAKQDGPDGGVEKNALGAIVKSQTSQSQNQTDNIRQTNIGAGIVFSVSGQAPNETRAQWNWKTKKATIGSHRYFTIRYKAKGVSRSSTVADVISASGFDAQGKRTAVSLLNNGNIINDGRTHVLHGFLKTPFSPASLQVDLTTRNSNAALEIESISFTQSPPDDSVFASRSAAIKGRFSSISLDSLFNDSVASLYQRVLAKNGSLHDGLSNFSSPSITWFGIPFQLGAAGRNLVLPIEDRSANSATVPFLGAQVPRSSFGPIGREDVITVPVGAKANEIFFILANEFVPTRTRYGSATIPYQFDDIDATFCVELHYMDGEIDKAFPYSLSDETFVLRRMIGVYAIPANPDKELKEFRLINRAHGNTTGLVAVTLNLGNERLVSKPFEEPALVKVPEVVTPPEQPATLRQTKNGLEGGNSFFRFAIDLSDGFRWADWVNLWSADAKVNLAKDSGLLIKWKGQELDGTKFKVSRVKVEGTSATIELVSKNPEVPLGVAIDLTVGNESQLKTQVSVSNTGSSEESFEVWFPWLKNVSIGKPSDTWLFFPKYGNVNSNKDGHYEGANDLMFPMQFFDMYNPILGGGLGIMTDNLKEVPLRYVASKNSFGVSAGIKYPGEFFRLPPSQTIEYPETSLVAHGGDWHEAFATYKKWVATWYKPYRSQDKKWFIDAFWIHTQITSRTLAESILLTPPLYDAKESKYWVDEVIQADKDVFGSVPDIANIFAWGYSDRLKDFLYSGSPEEAYEGVGGLALFKDAIHQFQDKHNIPVSLYLYPGPIGRKTAFGVAHGEGITIQREDGSLMTDSENWYACPGSQQWRDYFVDMTKQIQSDTQAKVIYLDVFGFTHAFSCYDTSHGHPIPYAGAQGTTPLLKELKAVLPEDSVLWHEYPVNDVSSQYSDGHLTYYYLPVRDLICPVYDVEEEAGALLKVSQDVYRYAFPHLKSFGFPCGIEEDTWGHLKFPFFNGEGTFDTTWRLYGTRTRELLGKSLELKREYSDCFNTLNPEPLVSTERANVYANKFPGKDRTLWTLYNERMTTVRGDVLSIPHIEGATYYDVWNAQTLQPRIENGRAVISLKLDPQAIGAVCQIMPDRKL